MILMSDETSLQEREHKDELWKMISEAVIKFVSLYPEDEKKGPALLDLISGHKDLFPERHNTPAKEAEP